MPTLTILPSADLPPSLKYQLLAYVRVEWAWVFQGPNRFWDFTQKLTHPVNVLLHERDVLISHAEVNWRTVDVSGAPLKCYGISAVFTFPAFRGEGHARRVVLAATDYIRHSDADLALLFCMPSLVPFYTACGWTALSDIRFLYGPATAPLCDEAEQALGLVVSARGRAALAQLRGGELYVGATTW